MNVLKHVVAALAMVGVTAPVAQAASVGPLLLLMRQAPPPTPEEAAVAALQKEYMAAVQEYQKPLMEAKTPEERQQVRLDPALHPASKFHPRFKELAQKYGRTKAGFTAWTLTMSTAMGMRDMTAAQEAQETLFRDFVNTDHFATYVPRIAPIQAPRVVAPEQREAYMAEMNAKVEELLVRVERASTNPEVLAAVLERRASMVRRDEAKVAEINKQLVAKYPNTAAGKRAKASVFEAENLVAGKPAPDFESEDVDGKKFRLSDYRGKVVLLEFFGFW